MFTRLAQQHREFVRDLVMNLQALAIALENQGYLASCYTCGSELNSASFMVSLGENHLIRFLVSDYGITWTEMRDDRELMKLEGAEAINQLQDLADLLKYRNQSFSVNSKQLTVNSKQLTVGALSWFFILMRYNLPCLINGT